MQIKNDSKCAALAEKHYGSMRDYDDCVFIREQLLDFNNEKVKEVVDQFIEDLSIGVCNLIDLFEPEIVVLGGSFSYYEGNPVYDRLLEKIKDKNSRFNKNAIPKIELAKLKNDAGIIGATIRI